MTEAPAYDIETTRVLDAPPERVYEAFTDPAKFAAWYGPVGFPVDRDTVELDARVGGGQRFEMVSDADPSLRTGFDGRFDEVAPNELLSSRGSWHGFPVRRSAGRRICAWSSTTTTARPGWLCARGRIRPARPIWAGRRGTRCSSN
jgi:uncharacterized protein YndB with AHSA1/START domain